jgi:ribosomal protein L24E
VHVDDFLVTCATKETVEKFLVEIKEIYKEVNTVFGTLHSFLGMTLDFSVPRKVNITMAKYVDDCLVEAEIVGIAPTPAAANLFDIGAHDTPKLDKRRHKLFHSRVYKLLYLARKTRPDMLTAVVFLTTRTQAPNELDWTKLIRVYKYLNGTRDLGIVLQSINRLVVSAWIDASFGVHPEMKSHTGSVISLGKGPIYVKSSKQKLNSLASTESELIGLSDESRQVIWTRNFLLHQGYDIGPAVIKQDNQSTIALAQKGRSTSHRTRHIAIRYFFIKDRIDCGEIRLEYCPTDEMIADVLTKPLQGEAFRKLRSELMNL